MPRARARCVVGLARALADDPGLADDDAALMALPGIGPWTVDYARFRNRRDPDVLLASDLAVRRAPVDGIPGDTEGWTASA
jgi:AraC family transcriptional regulator of adaptative response / DNA-3-methyladenine glycosylase II